jgi:glycosyltransferase involved in cell wall biosynthesis
MDLKKESSLWTTISIPRQRGKESNPGESSFMKYKVTIYSPDKHFTYNLHTLNEHGVGGGVTVRVRIAHSLARLGNQVELDVNCPFEGMLEGVKYQKITGIKKIKSDIFLASTSGGGLDLSPLSKMDVQSKLKILFLHGIAQPKGLDEFPFDLYYAPSNFLRKFIVEQWGIPASKVFVTYHGVEESLFSPSAETDISRDDHVLIYAGHPSKGLDTALAVMHLLRAEDPKFSLHVFGGYSLWGLPEQPLQDEDGLFNHGLVGQEELARWMQQSGFCLNLQSIEEAFGLVVNESMRAGSVVLASAVGAYPELIRDGYDGCLVRGIHTEDRTREIAAGMISELLHRQDYLEYLRRNSIHSPLSWETVARTWMGQWDQQMEKNSSRDMLSKFSKPCPECGGKWLQLADGLHCCNCGRYQKSLVD